MTEPTTTRRALLAGGTAGLVTLAGCSGSDLPFVGDDEPELGFDPAPLRQVVPSTRPEQPPTYIGPVPDQLAAHHRQRARELLDGIPEEPSIPNEAIAKRLTNERANVVEALANPPRATRPLERLGTLRYLRGNAASVRGAYEATNGAVDAESLSARRDTIRSDLVEFWVPWAYQSTGVVEAVAIHRGLESYTDTCRRYLTLERPFPSTPTAAVFQVGSLVAELERAQAVLDDLTGLWHAYQESTGTVTSYRDQLSIAATRHHQLVRVSRQQVTPYLGSNVESEQFQRDIESLPAERLFASARRVASSWIDEADNARQRHRYATTVVACGRALAGILTLASVVDGIQQGNYGMPDSREAVKKHREAAISAVQQTRAIEPQPLVALLTTPAWNALRSAENALGGYPERDREDWTPDQGDVVQAVASYVLARQFAVQLPNVVDRLVAELRPSGG